MKVFPGALVALGVACISNLAAAPLTFDFASVTGADITFDGAGHFGFTNSGPYDFVITDLSGGTGSGIGLQGTLGTTSSNVFTLGPITDSGFGLETAPVTGWSGMSIDDGTGHTLTGTLNFTDIYSLGNAGAVNGINAVVNFTALTYDGTNPDLVSLLLTGNATVTATYQFGQAESLALLTSNAIATTYSGTISAAAPEPASCFLAAIACGSFVLLRFRTRNA